MGIEGEFNQAPSHENNDSKTEQEHAFKEDTLDINAIEPSKQEQEEKNDAKSLLETESHIDELVRELELIEKAEQDGSVVGISSGALSEQRASIVKEISALDDEKSAWLKANNREELPEGISVAEEDGYVVKFNVLKEQTDKMSKEQRRRLIDRWQEESVEYFIKFYQSNWRSRSAVNLPQVLDVIKNNVPLAVERRAKKFLDGTSDFLPDFVFLDWKSTSILDRLTGKPNQIMELKIDFGGDSEVLATEADLVDQNQEKEKEDEMKDVERENGKME